MLLHLSACEHDGLVDLCFESLLSLFLLLLLFWAGTIPSLSVFSLLDLHLCMRTVNKLALTVPVDDPSLAQGIVCGKGGLCIVFLYVCMYAFACEYTSYECVRIVIQLIVLFLFV
jgi:hypothetical protein